LLLLAAACGPSATTGSNDLPAASAATASPARILIEGDDATRVIDAATGQSSEKTLPGGVLSPAKDLIVHLEREGVQTVLTGVDLGGRATPKLRLTGDYAFPSAYGAAPSGFSPNGAWLVLVSRDAGESRFQIVDIAKWTLAPTVTLSARFAFDAIHNDGSAMYLIEHPVATDTAYNVRLYRVRSQTLEPGIIFDKAAIAQYDPNVGIMDGTFHVSVAPKGGDWSYGLYMRPNGTPFVHALNVPGAYAQCILDLAGTWTSSSMFAMAMRDDGRRLYVVDTSGGAVTVIDGDSHAVLTRAQFAGRRPDSAVKTASAVVSRDGSRLYATSTRGIAVISTADLSLKTWIASDLAVSSLAVSSDGTRLYALADGAIEVIDASSGKVVVSRLADAPRARAIHLLPAR
jgi:WD40 repeat protein